jgi:ABC-type multidrug transport system ATPase subunit
MTTPHPPADSAQAEDRPGHAVEAVDLHQRLGGTEILSGVTVRVPRGETYGLLGPNGSGKTTTLRTLVGVLRPTDGRVRLLGAPPGDSPRVRRDLGVVFEHETLDPHWTVADNLAHTCAVYDRPRDRIDDALDRAGLDPGVRSTPFGDLSKGMQRKASLANALVTEPSVLVLDEPTSGLDPEARRRLRGRLDDLATTGTTVILSSHDLDDVSALCDRVGVVYDGQTVLETRLDEPATVADVTVPGGRTLDESAVTGADGRRVDVERLYFTVVGWSG